MPTSQLNKLQIKAEILTALARLQTCSDAAEVSGILEVLTAQNDKGLILQLLVKEFVKSNEAKAGAICFLMLNLCEKSEMETELWKILKNASVKDSIKALSLNVLRDLGHKVNYDELNDYVENPDEIIDADTQKLLKSAIINPEAQIDFIDFMSSLPDSDKLLLVDSLAEDYSSDELANILNPVCLYMPNSALGKKVIKILGETKSQLALHALDEVLSFCSDEEVVALAKKAISTLKIAGVREDNATEFYSNLLDSTFHHSYISFPDGKGNQAIIFSRLKANFTIQMVAIVVNCNYGVVDCFGFNEVSQEEFKRIVDRFYNFDQHTSISPSMVKAILNNAEALSRKTGEELSYEYICWKNLFSDIPCEDKSIESILGDNLVEIALTESNLSKINDFDFIQRWFFTVDDSSQFGDLVNEINEDIRQDNFEVDLEAKIERYYNLIFVQEQKDFLSNLILMSAYLLYLMKDSEMAQIFYSLNNNPVFKAKFSMNIIRKSIYEYYVSLKFKHVEQVKTANIFALKNNPCKDELKISSIEKVIELIENLWVED